MMPLGSPYREDMRNTKLVAPGFLQNQTCVISIMAHMEDRKSFSTNFTAALSGIRHPIVL